MGKRIEEIDYLRCIFISLMIIFHLAYIGDKYPYLKSIVYTFHMSGFLVISGFLANSNKDIFSFLKMITFIFIPYAIMEAGYVIMSSVLPIREHIDLLSPLILVEKIFISPMGPYWYLHTLILSWIVWYFLNNIFRRATKKLILHSILLPICFYVLSGLGLISFDNAIYFIFGILIKLSGINFTAVFQPTKFSFLPLAALCCFPDNLNRGSFWGIVITYLSICFFLSIYPFLSFRIKKITTFIGRNTLVLLLFSPIFTFLSKPLVFIFSFDPSGIAFASIATLVTILGSFGIAWIMDLTGFSKYFFGRKKNLI